MSHAQMIQQQDTTNRNQLYIAFELSNSKWKLLFSNGAKRRQKTIVARDLESLSEQIVLAKRRLKLNGEVEVFSCYEAGRDGFWLHRYLESRGVNNVVVDSSSIEVNRRYRRAKTDRIDVVKLSNMLIRYLNGEQKLWSVLHVPTANQEDMRRLNREMGRLKKEKAAHTNRMRSLLILHGIDLKIGSGFEEMLDEVVQWNGKKLPEQIKLEILREHKRYELIKTQLKELLLEKREILDGDSPQALKARALSNLRGIGEVSSWTLSSEFFGWREFKNVKQVGASSGLAPTPYASGDQNKEQGISKAGNRRVRGTMIELSWFWLRYQPQSALSRWFTRRFGGGGKRMRRIGIVAMARKLLVSLWKYLEKGLVPEGAVLKKLA